MNFSKKTKRRISTASILLVALGLTYHDPSFAEAETPARLTYAMYVARAQWPDSPCKGHEVISVVPDLNSMYPTVAASGYTMLGGSFPDDGSCLVLVDVSVTRNAYDYCRVLSHEFGHLAGMQHSTDPTDIMFPVAPMKYAPCIPLLPFNPWK